MSIREIKFRAFIKNLKWMVPVEMIDFSSRTVEVDLSDGNGDTSEYGFDEIELMQFTGLKDKNGSKEVYEGDIVSAYNGRIKGPVIFDSRGLAFGIPKGPNEIYQFSLNFLESKDIEVVGNIHEQTNES